MKKKVVNMTLGKSIATEKRTYFNPSSGFVFEEKNDGLGNTRINRMMFRVAVFV